MGGEHGSHQGPSGSSSTELHNWQAAQQSSTQHVSTHIVFLNKSLQVKHVMFVSSAAVCLGFLLNISNQTQMPRTRSFWWHQPAKVSDFQKGNASNTASWAIKIRGDGSKLLIARLEIKTTTAANDHPVHSSR